METKNSGSGVSPLSEYSGNARYSDKALGELRYTDKALASFATGTGLGVATFDENVGEYRRASGDVTGNQSSRRASLHRMAEPLRGLATRQSSRRALLRGGTEWLRYGETA